MDSSKVIVIFLGLVLLVCVVLVGIIALRGGQVPNLLDHVATGIVGGLLGAVTVRTTEPKP